MMNIDDRREQMVPKLTPGESVGVRREGLNPGAERRLEATMSRYFVDRVGTAANIEVLSRTEIVALFGSEDGQLRRVR